LTGEFRESLIIGAILKAKVKKEDLLVHPQVIFGLSLYPQKLRAF